MNEIFIFSFESSVAFIKAWAENLPKQGRGIWTKLSVHMGVSPTMVSQILSEEKPLSLESAVQIAEFIGLGEKEFDYFLLLVERERAGHYRLKQRYDAKIKSARKASAELSQRVKVDQELDETSKAIFYSSWLYSAARNLSALPEIGDVESLAEHLRLPRSTVAKVVQFLVEKNLCRFEDGRLSYSKKWTHIPSNSPLVVKHHQNWRLRGFQSMDDFKNENFFFTGPMSMSKDAAAEIRGRLPIWIEAIQKEVGPSESEVVHCLNIDWFEF